MAVQVTFSCMSLKGHGNEADFLGFLHKPVWHYRSLTLRSEPFHFSSEFSEIHNQKRFPNSLSRGVDNIAYTVDTVFFKPLDKSMVIVHYIPGSFFAKLIF
jgi:hypothetical protein